MPLAISGGCFSFAVKLKLKAHILVWFVQNFEAWEKKNPSLYPHLFSIYVCLFFFISLYLSMSLMSLWGSLLCESTLWNCRGGDGDWFKHTAVSTFTFHLCFDNTFHKRDLKWVLEFLSSPFDIKEWSLRWQNMQDSVEWINATLKVIPKVRHCFSTETKKQRDNGIGCLYRRADSSHAHQQQERLPVWNVYTANIK